MSVAIQASKANEAIQTIFDQNVDYVIPPYEISKSGFNILIQGKMNHILIKVRKFCYKESFIIWKKFFYSGLKFKKMRVDVVNNKHHQIELTVTFAAGSLKINLLPINIDLQNVEVKFKSGITANKVRIFWESHIVW